MNTNIIYNDQMARLSFGDSVFEISQYPHIIVKANKDNLTSIFEAIGVLGGIVGDSPDFDKLGGLYVEPEDGLIIDDFALWQLPENQRVVRERGCFAKLGSFTMIVDAQSKPNTIRMVYELFKKNTPTTQSIFDYYNAVTKITKIIQFVNWAYIPLSDETEYAIFITNHNSANLLEAVTNRLRRSMVSAMTLSCRAKDVS